MQVVEAHLAQIHRHNDDLQAVVSLADEQALAAAAEADRRQRAGAPLGPLHGVPMTIGDGLRVRGMSSTFGGLPLFYFRTPAATARWLPACAKPASFSGTDQPAADGARLAVPQTRSSKKGRTPGIWSGRRAVRREERQPR